ncbi:hypothetical protein [Streptomyces sp. NPDC096012]|uniref:nSTAND1 domain-containing NTPase n=1 Tax=Streptomyces sp. NPDC096012 TaxID=3155684 RepID=UPI00336AE0BB
MIAPRPRGGRLEPGDAGLFFGRDQLTDRLLELVSSRRFTAVFGPSGSGKSSLLRARLTTSPTSRRPVKQARCPCRSPPRGRSRRPGRPVPDSRGGDAPGTMAWAQLEAPRTFHETVNAKPGQRSGRSDLWLRN